MSIQHTQHPRYRREYVYDMYEQNGSQLRKPYARLTHECQYCSKPPKWRFPNRLDIYITMPDKTSWPSPSDFCYGWFSSHLSFFHVNKISHILLCMCKRLSVVFSEFLQVIRERMNETGNLTSLICLPCRESEIRRITTVSLFYFSDYRRYRGIPVVPLL